MKTYKFYQEDNQRWYIDLPNWTGSKNDLEMVSGANTLLSIFDIKSKHEIFLNISLEKFENSDKLVLINKDDTIDTIGGGYYYFEKYLMEIWLCNVTKFVFGYMPQEIYIKKLEN